MALLSLLASGCLGKNFLMEPAAYEIQVRDRLGRFVEGARVVATPLTWTDGRTEEGWTDARGRCVLEVQQSSGGTARGSDLRARPWLSVGVEAKGFESRLFLFTRDEFIDDGGMLRRVEGIELRAKSP